MKIFGTGLGKTGTKSLQAALKELGFIVKHFPTNLDFSKCDGGVDTTVSAYWPELFEVYPDAKFIHTYRQLPQWLDSWQRHIAKHSATETEVQKLIRMIVFGQLEFDAHVWSSKYHTNELLVEEGIARAPDRFLTLHIADRDTLHNRSNWELLADFLGVENYETKKAFPKRGADRQSQIGAD